MEILFTQGDGTDDPRRWEQSSLAICLISWGWETRAQRRGLAYIYLNSISIVTNLEYKLEIYWCYFKNPQN